jgi:hypothetical protein
MSKKVILHLSGEDLILGEITDLPGPSDQFITVRNIRKRDGKPLPYVDNEATSFLFPLLHLTFIEVLDEEEQEDGLVPFFREDSLPKRR